MRMGRTSTDTWHRATSGSGYYGANRSVCDNYTHLREIKDVTPQNVAKSGITKVCKKCGGVKAMEEIMAVLNGLPVPPPPPPVQVTREFYLELPKKLDAKTAKALHVELGKLLDEFEGTPGLVFSLKLK